MNELVAALLLKKYGSGGGGSTPTGEINITDDGTYNVTDKASAVVRNQMLRLIVDANYTEIMQTFTIPDDVTKLRNGCQKLRARNIIANGVLQLGEKAFSDNDDVYSLNLPLCTELGVSALRSMDALVSVNLPELTIAYNYNFTQMAAVTELFLPKLTTAKTSFISTCTALTKAVVPKLQQVETESFSHCGALVNLSLPSLTKINGKGLFDCSSLTNLFLPQSTMAVKANSDALMATPIWRGDGTIWVNDNLVNTYKSATNWIVLASYIKPISEYTGDFDYMEGVS